MLWLTRSPVLWLLPLFGSIAAIITAQASAHVLADHGLTVSGLSSDILIVLVFGAGSDYALLLVHKLRGCGISALIEAVEAVPLSRCE